MTHAREGKGSDAPALPTSTLCPASLQTYHRPQYLDVLASVSSSNTEGLPPVPLRAGSAYPITGRNGHKLQLAVPRNGANCNSRATLFAKIPNKRKPLKLDSKIHVDTRAVCATLPATRAQLGLGSRRQCSNVADGAAGGGDFACTGVGPCPLNSTLGHEWWSSSTTSSITTATSPLRGLVVARPSGAQSALSKSKRPDGPVRAPNLNRWSYNREYRTNAGPLRLPVNTDPLSNGAPRGGAWDQHPRNARAARAHPLAKSRALHVQHQSVPPINIYCRATCVL